MKKFYVLIIVIAIGGIAMAKKGLDKKKDTCKYIIHLNDGHKKLDGITLTLPDNFKNKDELTLNVQDNWKNLSFLLLDTNNLVRMSSVLEEGNSPLILAPYTSGTYFIKINQKHKTIATYRIIKD